MQVLLRRHTLALEFVRCWSKGSKFTFVRLLKLWFGRKVCHGGDVFTDMERGVLCELGLKLKSNRIRF